MNKNLLMLAEKVGLTFAYTFAGVFATGASIYAGQPWLTALDSAAFAAVVALITGLLTLGVAEKLTGVQDAVLRVALTFGQAFLGVVTASAAASFISIDWKGALAAAVPATALALVKVLVSLSNKNTVGASAIPKYRLT